MAPRSTMARQSQAAPGGFRASRFEMRQQGVPEDYIDALLDDDYMHRLIEATNYLNESRRKQLKRYYRMNTIIFYFLICQSILGIFVALYKSVLQPDKVFSSNTRIGDVHMVLMLDTSNHMATVKDKQQEAAVSLSGLLSGAMSGKRAKIKAQAEEDLQRQQKANSNWLSWIFNIMIGWMSKTKKDEATVSGGTLFMSTGVFNGEDTRILHPWTSLVDVQNSSLRAMSEKAPTAYKVGVSRWYDAFDKCEQEFSVLSLRPDDTKFCVIIGDDQAMCNKRDDNKVNEICNQFPEFCVPSEEIKDQGIMLEYAEELKECQTKNQNLVHKGIQLIMMFTVMNSKEGQLRLANPAFKGFVENTTTCEILRSDTEVTVDGRTESITTFEPSPKCTYFFMGNGFDEVTNKSKSIADMLKDQSAVLGTPNAKKDYRFLVFLLLPLNLVFYVVWSKIVRCGTHVRTKAKRAMGAKKKMIKVTKSLVEKARRDSGVLKLAAQLTEVEMAEVSSLRSPIEFGAQMTLRARLKGGYLRKAGANADGSGNALDKNANWVFEKVDDSEGDAGVQVGQRVRIKNPKNNCYVSVDEMGTVTFVPLEQASLHSARLQFMAEPTTDGRPDESPYCRLGDTLRVRSAATGKLLQVKKDGTADGLGDAADPESQFVIDRGGPTVNSGAIVTIRSNASDTYLHGTPEGIVNASPGAQAKDWRYWLVEKTGHVGHAIVNYHGGQAATAEDEASASKPLQVGDIITLRGFNQNPLEVDAKGRCFAGRPPAGAAGGASSSSSGGGLGLGSIDEEGAGAGGSEEAGNKDNEPVQPVVQEFVIERVGMGLIAKNDQTIRRGAEVCLRPLRRDADGQVDYASTYLTVNEDGAVVANGRATSQQISFTIEQASMHDILKPIHANMAQGDVELLFAPLWNKADIKRLDALSSSWTHDEDLSNFKGAVVVASDKGTYTVPKAKGDGFQGWVAVVNEGVDIHKAARQAKLQGATGLIIKCDEALSLERLAHGVDASNPPELPAVYVNKDVAEALNERGINLKGCEFKKKYMTEVMRSVGRAAAGSSQGNPLAEVFKSVGTAMLEKHKEKELEPVEEEERMEYVEEEDVSQSAYKWKVSSNTHYLWSKSGGGATKMNVNYGAKAPPSAHKETKTCGKTGREIRAVDASADLFMGSGQPSNRRSRAARRSTRTSVVGVAMVEADDLRNHRLAHQLSEILTTEEGASEPLEQLSDESDFKIEYAFEEVEVAVGQKVEDMEEEELMDDEGAVIRTLGVPQGKFWLVACGLLLSTSILLGVLFWILNSDPGAPPAPKPDAGPMPPPKVVADIVTDSASALGEWMGNKFMSRSMPSV